MHLVAGLYTIVFTIEGNKVQNINLIKYDGLKQLQYHHNSLTVHKNSTIRKKVAEIADNVLLNLHTVACYVS